MLLFISKMILQPIKATIKNIVSKTLQVVIPQVVLSSFQIKSKAAKVEHIVHTIAKSRNAFIVIIIFVDVSDCVAPNTNCQLVIRMFIRTNHYLYIYYI